MTNKMFVGWVGAVQPEAEELWTPTPPKSYKSKEAQDGWIADHRSNAAILPFVGYAASCCLLGSDGEKVYEGTNVAEIFRITNGFGNFSKFSSWGSAPEEPSALFIGFNVKQLFQSVAVELLREHVAVPLRYWRSPPGVVDIFETLVPGDLRNGFDVGSLIQYLGPTFFPQAFHGMAGPGNAVLETAESRARMAMALSNFALL